MQFQSEAIVCGVLTHGEHGAIVRMLTPDHGLVAAYVRGGRGRRMRPLLIPGNAVFAQLRARTDNQLPQAVLELEHSRAPILGEALPSAAIEWSTALIAAALPERQPYPRIYQAFSGLLDAVEAAPTARGWGAALARFEQIVVAELGYERRSAGALAEADWRDGDWPDVLFALEASGRSLFREVLPSAAESLRDCRCRLIDRLLKASA